MQSGNLARMDNIAGTGHTNTKWWVRLEQGRSHNRVLRNRVHSTEQSPKPRQGTRAQDRDQERLRLLRHAILRRIRSLLYSGIEQMMVQQTTLARRSQ
jgi:hypothetical protein